MHIRILPYKLGSASAKLLKEGLLRLGHNVLLVKPDGRYRYRQGHKIINWGTSHIPEWMTNEAVQNTLNKPHNVANASNKLRCFQTLYSSEIPTVPFTTDKEVARQWNAPVYVRHTLNGHSGEGIEIVENTNRIDFTRLGTIQNELDEMGLGVINTDIDRQLELMRDYGEMELPDAPLYTKKIENTGEYRVHVFNGEVIDYRKKSRHRDDEPTDAQSDIRTLANGWVYRSQNLNRLERVENLALSAIDALGLDFGAVDIIKAEDGNVYVLEVNTACGMEEATLNSYINAIQTCLVE